MVDLRLASPACTVATLQDEGGGFPVRKSGLCDDGHFFFSKAGDALFFAVFALGDSRLGDSLRLDDFRPALGGLEDDLGVL